MNETIKNGGEENERAQIEKSLIERGRRLFDENSDEWPGFLNNFYTLVLPEKNGKFIGGRDKCIKLGWLDKKHKDLVDESSYQHSELWLNQTGQEFFETIDRVIDGLDVDGEIKIAIEKFCNVTDYEERCKEQRNLEEKLIPVLARLVAMGYVKQELTE